MALAHGLAHVLVQLLTTHVDDPYVKTPPCLRHPTQKKKKRKKKKKKKKRN